MAEDDGFQDVVEIDFVALEFHPFEGEGLRLDIERDGLGLDANAAGSAAAAFVVACHRFGAGVSLQHEVGPCGVDLALGLGEE